MDSQFIAFLFFANFFKCIWVFYNLYLPVRCDPYSRQCLKNYLTMTQHPPLKLWVYTSTSQSTSQSWYRSDLYRIWEPSDFKPNENIVTDVSVRIPVSMVNNGKFFVHVFLAPVEGRRGKDNPFSADWRIHQKAALTFCTSPQKSVTGDRSTCIWRSHLLVNVMTDDITFDSAEIPDEMAKYIRQVHANEYLPILTIDEASRGTEDFLPVNNTVNEMPLRIVYMPLSYVNLCQWINAKATFAMLELLSGYKDFEFGFEEKEVNGMRNFLFNSSLPCFFILEFIQKFLILFWLLADHNDIRYWEERKTMSGLSTITVFWHCVSTVVLFLHRMDEHSFVRDFFSIIPAGIASVTELRKVWKAWMTEWRTSADFDDQERETHALNSQVMRYLTLVDIPLWCVTTIYTVMYNFPESGSWYSCYVRILRNGVYSFGFIYILPQVFINYKLKSVADLPWKVLMYKAGSSFMNDINNFIFMIPIDDGGACFRYDVVFLIYLYQRWLYSPNKTREKGSGQSLAKKISGTGGCDMLPSSS